MSIRHLSHLLSPGSIALIGASAREASLGRIVLSNLLAADFPGDIFAVNPHPVDLPGVIWSPGIGALPLAPDLAVVMTPAAAVPDVIAELGRLGTKVAVVLSAGVDAPGGLRTMMLDAARASGVRIVGPNCLGVLMPHANLNASFAHLAAKPGRLGLISQSGALVTAMLDWAAPRDIGFSAIVSAGEMADVDIADLIDLLATDPNTDAILLHVEGITNAAKFMSAARAAARVQPIVAIKAGRRPDACRAALSHSGALAGSYPVYRAAFAQAGIVMVDSLTQLFDAAEVLCKLPPLRGDRLAIVTNGGGAGVLAVDELPGCGGRLANLDPSTIEALDEHLPTTWSRANPIDIIGDAGPIRYRAAVAAAWGDPGVDAILVMHCPTAMASPVGIAETLSEQVSLLRKTGPAKPVIACWLGDATCESAGDILGRAGIPLFSAPDDAVRGFGYLLAAQAARAALTETVPVARPSRPDRKEAARIIAAARAEGRLVLNEIEAKALLSAYAVPVVTTHFAAAAGDVVDACAGLTAPYAVKIVSPDISHKSDKGGVALGLCDPAVAAARAFTMGERIRREHPEARITGFAVEKMCVRPHASELLIGVANDPTFGPVLLFGAGGKAVEAINDIVMALPPIHIGQAREMIGRTRIARLLAGYRDERAADLTGIAETLVAVSNLVTDWPDIVELDINPLLADADGILCLDARVVITQEARPASRLAIRPVPTEWSADLVTRSGQMIHVRPVVPSDEAALAAFFEHVTPEDLRFRFLSSVRHVDHETLAMMTHVDYRRTISFLALEPGGTIVAAVLLATDADRSRAEIAMSTRSDWKGRGVSYALLSHLLRYAEAEGIAVLEAVELADHSEALRMEREMGFTALACPDDPTLRIVRRQRPIARAA